MHLHPRIMLTAAMFLPLVACAPDISPKTAALFARLNGVYVADGYGYVLDFRSGARQAYHLFDDHCVLDKEASAELHLILGPDNIIEAADNQSIAFGDQYEPHKTVLYRESVLPAPCEDPLPNTPQGNFDAFTGIFAAHYAFFDLYGVKWPDVVATAQPLVSPSTTDEELFAIFAEMVEPLHDSHLTLRAEIRGREYSAEPGTTVLGRGIERRAVEKGVDEGEVAGALLDDYWNQGVAIEVLGGEGKEVAGGKLQYGFVDDTVGYINVLMLLGYTQDGLIRDASGLDQEAEHQRINEILDDILVDFTQAQVGAVIIDVSVNFGGQDFMAREIAARFADQRTLAYTKVAFDATDTTETPVYITPSERPSFLGPVYLMTTDSTVSAGEIMTMSLRALSNVTHVGQPTSGALSDILNKSLPNGWSVNLSNEVYHDHDGQLWEGRGIMPDVLMEISNETYLLDGHTAAVAAVVARIQSDLAE